MYDCLFSVTLFFFGAFLLPVLLLVSKEYVIFVKVTKNVVTMARQKEGVKPKNFVRLRSKILANGNKSLYLDIYRDGARNYEFLKMYIVPDKNNATARQQNENTLQAAEVIRSERQNAIVKGQAGIADNSAKNKLLLMDWLKIYRAKLEKRQYKDISHVDNLMRILAGYKPATVVKLTTIDKGFAKGFIDYLKHDYISYKGNKRLQNSTIVDYVRTFSVAINAAIKDGYKIINPFKLLSSDEKVKQPDSHREYLSQEELQKLMAIPCRREDIGKAYLFSCFSGLRISDIRLLKWKNIVTEDGQVFATLFMQKTGKELRIPLPGKAIEIMPVRGNDEDYVFPLPSNPTIEDNLKKWAEAAEIKKHLTFHTARHTYATLLLTLGADLYTVSKMLGHTNIATTQIYAKVVDKKKVDAVNLVNDMFNK